MIDLSASYTKIGATFASGAEAYADKNSLYGPTLTDSVQMCYDNMLTNGVLLEPISPTWDQSTQILTVHKMVTSAAAYDASITFNGEECISKSALAGWQYNS